MTLCVCVCVWFRNRDLKNRELFEKTFPELKARREQQERFMRCVCVCVCVCCHMNTLCI